MQARDRNLETWFSRIANGQIEMPRFQRFEAWGYREVSDLLQTVLDELPAGAALILDVGDQIPFRTRPLEQATAGPERITELLLDGQQRLTGFWRSLLDSYPDRTFFVDLNSTNEETGGNAVVSYHRYIKEGRRYPLWAESPQGTYERGLLPVRLLKPGKDGENALKSWLAAATDGDISKQFALYEIATNLRMKLSNFNLPFLSLPIGTRKEVVLDVFVKMNTRSVPLKPFDIIVANVEGETGESLHDLLASLNGQVPALGRYGEPSEIALSVAALLQDRSPNRSGHFGLNWERLVSDWEQLVEGARRTVAFLEQEKVPDGARLPTIVPIAPLVALWSAAPTSPDALGNARTLLRSYMWRAFFTDRYERASATASLQDYRALAPAVSSGEKVSSAPIFDQPLPDSSELLETLWPKKRDRLARAVLLLSFQGRALDLADGSEMTPMSITSREYHHIFPVAYLREIGRPDGDANTALNCALVTWRTNRTIGAKEPWAYLLERTQASALGSEELRARVQSHAIPFEEMVAGDFDAFKIRRAELYENAIEQLCGGFGWTANE